MIVPSSRCLWLLLVCPMVWAEDYAIINPLLDADDIFEHWRQGFIREEQRDRLLSLLQNPLELNLAAAGALTQLPGIDPELARRIIAARPYERKRELLRKRVLSLAQYQDLRAFITVERQGGEMRSLALRSDEGIFLGRLQQRRGSLSGTVEMVNRQRYTATYHTERGSLLSEGQRQAKLEQAGLRWRTPAGRFWLGDYRLFFGSGLVIGSGNGEGVSPAAKASVDFWQGGIYRGRNFRGLAHESQHGRVRLTAFAAETPRAVYQYDMQYGADAWMLDLLGECVREGQEREAFVCDAEGNWRSHRVVDGESTQNQHYLTLEQAYEESGQGAALSFLHANWQAGWTYLQLENRFLLEAPAVDFAPGAGILKGRHVYQGAFLRLHGDAWFWLTEGALQDERAPALLSHARLRVASGEYELRFRHYDGDYRNPYHRAYAQADQSEGWRNSNESGWRFDYRTPSLARGHLRLSLDHWRMAEGGSWQDWQAVQWRQQRRTWLWHLALSRRLATQESATWRRLETGVALPARHLSVHGAIKWLAPHQRERRALVRTALWHWRQWRLDLRADWFWQHQRRLSLTRRMAMKLNWRLRALEVSSRLGGEWSRGSRRAVGLMTLVWRW